MQKIPDQISVALVQQASRQTTEDNLNHTVDQIRQAARSGAQLVVLQELHCSPYFCQVQDTANFDLAESIPGPTTGRLSQVAAESGVVLVASLFERRARGLYHNTAVVIERDGSLAGIYRKMHIPQDPGFEEKFYFTPGDLGFHPIRTSIGTLGVLVCWDQWYPEAARLMALRGADLLIYPTAIGWDPADGNEEQQRQLDAWVTVQRGHAVANGIHVLTCNRTGTEAAARGTGAIRFWGNSFVTGPQGELLAVAPQEEETILRATISLQRAESVRRIWPFFRDRRIDAYGDIVRRHVDDTPQGT